MTWVSCMGSLTFIGMGLYDEKGISLYGLEKAKEADEVFLERYTSIMPGLDLPSLESLIGKKVKVLGRKIVEDGKEIIQKSSSKRVAFLVAGDPFVATTHIDLRMRAMKMGIPVDVVHAPSTMSVAPGVCGLQNYKFGKSSTITLETRSEVPYDTLMLNKSNGLHTLFFLDLNVEEECFMSAGEGVRLLMEMESRRGEGFFTDDALSVGIARAGGPEQMVRAATARELLEVDFGRSPHTLIVPGKLHFMEAEALVLLAGADEGLVRRFM